MQRLFWDTEAANVADDDEDFKRYRLRAGIGFALVYEPETDVWDWYDAFSLDDLAVRLEHADEVVGYNSIGYDHLVLDADLGRRVWIKSESDLWVSIKSRLDRKWPAGSWGLGDVCERTLGIGKLGHGADAPRLLQEGRIGALATYLQRDVQLTYWLWRFIEQHGYVIDPEGAKLEVDNHAS